MTLIVFGCSGSDVTNPYEGAAGFGSGGYPFANGGAAGSSGTPTQPLPTCGNGVLDPGEQCEGATTTETCATATMGVAPIGTVACNNCVIDTRGCTSAGGGGSPAQGGSAGTFGAGGTTSDTGGSPPFGAGGTTSSTGGSPFGNGGTTSNTGGSPFGNGGRNAGGGVTTGDGGVLVCGSRTCTQKCPSNQVQCCQKPIGSQPPPNICLCVFSNQTNLCL